MHRYMYIIKLHVARHTFVYIVHVHLYKSIIVNNDCIKKKLLYQFIIINVVTGLAVNKLHVLN